MTIIRKEFPVKGRKRPVVKYRYAVTYKDPFGESHRKYSKWFLSQKEAEAAQAEFKASPTLASKTKFIDVALQCMEQKKKRISEKTYIEQMRFINLWFKPLHQRNIDRISPKQIQAIFEPIQYLSTSRLNKVYGTLKSIFEYAVIYYDLSANPMQKIPRFKRPDDSLRKETSIWTEAELKAFLDAVPDNKWQYRILYHFLFYTGMRKNEALSLTWNDYDGKKVKVYRQFQNGKWKPLKTKNSIRNIVLDPVTIEKINELHSWAESQTNYSPNWFIFGDFKQMGTSEIGRVKDKAIKEAGVPYIRIHDLRHSHASYLINKGVNMVIVSRRLGHSSIQMTIDRYTHLLPDAQDEVIKAIME